MPKIKILDGVSIFKIRPSTRHSTRFLVCILVCLFGVSMIQGVSAQDYKIWANTAEIAQWNGGGSIFGLDIVGNYAYLADYYEGLKILDISNPYIPIEVGKITDLSGLRSVSVKGDYAYLGSEFDGMKIVDISDPSNPILKNQSDYVASVSNVSIQGNIVYEASLSEGLKIMNVSDPHNPVLIGNFSNGEYTGVYVIGEYAYLAEYYDVYNSGLEIFNIADPQNPVNISHVDIDLIVDFSVYVIDTYAFVGFDEYWQLVDVSDPYNPFKLIPNDLGTVNLDNEISSDIYVEGNYAYITLNTGINIGNIADPGNPIATNWINEDNYYQTIFTSENYAFVGNSQNGLVIYNISSLYSPVKLGSIEVCQNDEAPVKIEVVDDIAYVLTYEGFLAIDILDRNNPTEIDRLEMHSDGQDASIFIKGDYAYIADAASAFTIVDITDPSELIVIGRYSDGKRPRGVCIVGEYAYIADENLGLKIFDITDMRDTDRDGMPDWWEKHFDLDPLVDDANLDADRDGIANYLEYIQGLNPNFVSIGSPLFYYILGGILIVLSISIIIMAVKRKSKHSKEFTLLKSKIIELKKQPIESILSEWNILKKKSEEVGINFENNFKFTELGKGVEEFYLTGVEKSIEMALDEAAEKKNHLEELKRQLENQKIQHLKNKKDSVLKFISKLLLTLEIPKIKKTILELGSKYPRLDVGDIEEVCGVSEPKLIIGIIKDMISSEEIYARYFKNSRSVAFDQQANLEELGRLDDLFSDWSEKEISKMDKIDNLEE
ncbi:MAG: hypothetical protein ACTSRK_00015 [Promethearchaeota archaeon]